MSLIAARRGSADEGLCRARHSRFVSLANATRFCDSQISEDPSALCISTCRLCSAMLFTQTCLYLCTKTCSRKKRARRSGSRFANLNAAGPVPCPVARPTPALAFESVRKKPSASLHLPGAGKSTGKGKGETIGTESESDDSRVSVRSESRLQSSVFARFSSRTHLAATLPSVCILLNSFEPTDCLL